MGAGRWRPGWAAFTIASQPVPSSHTAPPPLPPPPPPPPPSPTHQVDHVKAERNLLAEVRHHSVVRLYYSFQDEAYLYLVRGWAGQGAGRRERVRQAQAPGWAAARRRRAAMPLIYPPYPPYPPTRTLHPLPPTPQVMEYLQGGDMMTLLIRKEILPENWARFYLAQARQGGGGGGGVACAGRAGAWRSSGAPVTVPPPPSQHCLHAAPPHPPLHHPPPRHAHCRRWWRWRPSMRPDTSTETSRWVVGGYGGGAGPQPGLAGPAMPASTRQEAAG